MGYERKERYALQFIFDLIGQEDREIDGDSIHMNSLRYPVFQRQPCCVKCGLEGQYFFKERMVGRHGERLAINNQRLAISERGACEAWSVERDPHTMK